MSDPQSANIAVYQVPRGGDSGTWDSPTNANWGAMDSLFANVSTIALTNSPVTLTTPPNSGASWSGPYQSQSGILRFTGTLSAAVTVTLPRAGFWIVENLCTVSTYYVALASAAPGNVICAPPGEATHVYCDGTDVRYIDLGRVGSYLDLGTATVPAWITNCTVKPYLNCDGTTFSAITYPALNALLGGNTLPDLRGRVRAALNQGTGRISASGVNGDTFLAAGGADTETILKANLPSYNLTVTDPGHSHTISPFTSPTQVGSGPAIGWFNTSGSVTTSTNTTGITVGSGGSGTALETLPPVQIAGLTLIRAG